MVLLPAAVMSCFAWSRLANPDADATPADDSQNIASHIIKRADEYPDKTCLVSEFAKILARRAKPIDIGLALSAEHMFLGKGNFLYIDFVKTGVPVRVATIVDETFSQMCGYIFVLS